MTPQMSFLPTPPLSLLIHKVYMWNWRDNGYDHSKAVEQTAKELDMEARRIERIVHIQGKWIARWTLRRRMVKA